MVEQVNQLPGGEPPRPALADVAEATEVAARETEQPAHLVRLEGREWGLWRWVGLRGAGFPAALPLKLASAPLDEAADALCEAEAETARARSAAITAVHEAMRSAEDDQQPQLKKALRRLIKNSAPDPLPESCTAAAPVAAYAQAASRLEEARARFGRTFEEALAETSAALREVVADPSFQEAVIWQNRRAYHTGMRALLRGGEEGNGRGSKQRQHEELVASYLQRYCLKNDTIGFFGPVGWAKLAPEDESLTAQPGDRLLAARGVYFEAWAIHALAKVIGANRRLKPYLAPRRLPLVHVEERTLYSPFRPPSKLTDKLAVVLAACEGDRTAKELARGLSQQFPQFLKSEAEVYTTLESLKAMRLINWEMEVPVGVNSERTLRRYLERVEDAGLRSEGLALLGDIEAARDAVASAAGRPAELDQALDNLDALFAERTELSPTRNAGQMYAARTLAYEDCRRDIEVKVGSEVINSLGEPLSLVLTSARWLTYRYAEFYRHIFHKIYDDLARRSRSTVVEGHAFMLQAQTVLRRERVAFDNDLVEEFQRQWSGVLNAPEGERRLRFTAAELEPRLRAAFDAPRAGWSFARYHSPDIMIDAAGVEAVQRGEYQFVLGELHLGVNTLGAAFFHEQHPAPEELISAADSDLPEPRLELLRAQSEPKLNSRSLIGLVTPKDYFLALSPDACGASAAQTVSIGSLVVEKRDGELILRTRDGRLKYEIVEALGGLLSNLSFNSFRVLEPRARTPRVTIDRLVVCREAWRFRPAEMAFAHEKDEAARFLAARRWAREHGMPRFVFTKSPVEVKPCYVDFASPVYVNIFAKIVRRTLEQGDEGAQILVSEMLPTAERTWLPDAEGRSYTSEFRVVALDLLT